ncbi:MAG: hypothetical protein QN168_04415 [Armatimonadota bacterium]|nr:hypothetical protein [Armatimonadota bacterium]
MAQDVSLVPIPTALYRRVEAALDRLGQPSVEAFVAFAVRAALGAHEPSEPLSGDEEARIVERLRRLGYLE